MSIREYEFYHGAALLVLLQDCKTALSIRERDDLGRGCYEINGGGALYVKHCSKRLSPWLFTFSTENQEVLESLASAHSVCRVALVCHSDGIVVLDVSEARYLLGNREHAWIRAERRMREMYEVTGAGGALNHKVADSEFVAFYAALSADTLADSIGTTTIA